MFERLRKLFNPPPTPLPGQASDYKAQGDAHLDLGQWNEAIACYRQALAHNPANAAVHNNLALALARAGRREEAEQALRQALQLDPASFNAHYQLATLAYDAGRLDLACTHTREAVCIAPDFAAGWSFLGNGLREQGKTAEAVAAYRRALDLDPGDLHTRSNLLIALEAEGVQTQVELHAEHRRYGALFAPPAIHSWPPMPPRLRIGYVSADFRLHSVAHFMIPILEHHDHSRFDIHCYYSRHDGDSMTQRFAELAGQFIACAGMSDAELAARIRADGIDVLVDLSGHTAGHRLPVFALKPAPVQVSYLGYVDTTGLDAMDYRLTCNETDPPGNDAYASERLYRLPQLWWTFQPVAGLPDVVPLPAETQGAITFCSSNQIAKITPAMLGTWAAILHAVPGSTLTLMGISGDAAERHFLAAFATHGIGPERLSLQRFLALDGFRARLAQSDIALDTFPYNGGTTTCETLWLGLPCITLRGQSFASRMGHALLKEIGLEELVADSFAQYTAVAVALAQDLPRLKAMRMGLRDRLAASSLGDAAGFTHRLEQAYLDMRAAVR